MSIISNKKRVLNKKSKIEYEVSNKLRQIVKLCSKEMAEACIECREVIGNKVTVNGSNVKAKFFSIYVKEMASVFEDIMELTNNHLIDGLEIYDEVYDATYIVCRGINNEIGVRGWTGDFGNASSLILPALYADEFIDVFSEYLDFESIENDNELYNNKPQEDDIDPEELKRISKEVEEYNKKRKAVEKLDTWCMI